MKTSLLKLFCFSIFTGAQLMSYAQPANDAACEAIVIILDDPAISTDNSDATVATDEVVPPAVNPPDDCFSGWCDGDPDAQNSVWFTFVAPASGAVEINTCIEGTVIDTQLALWEVATCSDFSTFSFVAASDDIAAGCDAGNQYSSLIAIDGLIAGNTYYVQADGFDGDAGVFFIEINTSVPTSRVNFIHNCADLTASTFDLRINGELIAADFLFQTCTGYSPIEAEINSYITINPVNSVDDSAPLYTLNYVFDATSDYVLTLEGILADVGYTPTQEFGFAIFENAQLNSIVPGTLSALFFHGVTDAPALDLMNYETSNIINNDLAYGTYSNEAYVTLDGSNFSLSLTDEEGNDLGLNFCAPFQGAGQSNAAFTIVISGFATPANNSNGAELGVYLVNHFDGTFIPLDAGLCPFPDNDDICNPASLVVNDPPSTFDNSLATVQEGESTPFNTPNNDPEADCIGQWCDGSLDNTLWFTFVAPASGSVAVSTCFDETFDTQITICTIGDCNDFSSVNYLASNDDMEGGCTGGDQYASYLTYASLTPGNTYFIQMDGWGGDTGAFDIQVTDLVNVNEASTSALNIFPNPANHFIQVMGLHGNALVEMHDITGKKHLSQTISNGGSIDVSALSGGVYSMNIFRNDTMELHLIIVE